jgi:hypothetical protein
VQPSRSPCGSTKDARLLRRKGGSAQRHKGRQRGDTAVREKGTRAVHARRSWEFPSFSYSARKQKGLQQVHGVE